MITNNILKTKPSKVCRFLRNLTMHSVAPQNNKPLSQSIRDIPQRSTGQEYKTIPARTGKRRKRSSGTGQLKILALRFHSGDFRLAGRLQHVCGRVPQGSAEHVDHEAVWPISRGWNLPDKQAVQAETLVQGG